MGMARLLASWQRHRRFVGHGGMCYRWERLQGCIHGCADGPTIYEASALHFCRPRVPAAGAIEGFARNAEDAEFILEDAVTHKQHKTRFW